MTATPHPPEAANEWSAALLRHLERIRTPPPGGTVIVGCSSHRLAARLVVSRSAGRGITLAELEDHHRNCLEELRKQPDLAGYLDPDQVGAYRDCPELTITLRIANPTEWLRETLLAGGAVFLILLGLSWLIGSPNPGGAGPAEAGGAAVAGLLWLSYRIWRWHQATDAAIDEILWQIEQFQPSATAQPRTGFQTGAGSAAETLAVSAEPLGGKAQ